MKKLNTALKSIVTDFSAGAVATINEDGTPAVSPKATFVIVDDQTIAFGDIRSPGTVENLRRQSAVEVVFTDILNRKAARIRGQGTVLDRESERWSEVAPLFEKQWSPYFPHMKHLVVIDIEEAKLAVSPAYDLGFSADQLRKNKPGEADQGCR